MKNLILCILAMLTIQAGFSQTTTGNQSTLDSVSKVVIHYLQAKQADSIYALAGEKFRSTLTAENFKSIAENQVFKINDFTSATYVNTTNGINKYKVTGTPELQILIGLDKANKLETLLIQPFSNQ